MKKQLFCIFYLVFILGCKTTGVQNNHVENGFYYITNDKTIGVKIMEKGTDKVFYINNMLIFTKNDFEKVEIVNVKRYNTVEPILVFNLNENGNSKLREAEKRTESTNENVVFVYENKVLNVTRFFNIANQNTITIPAKNISEKEGILIQKYFNLN